MPKVGEQKYFEARLALINKIQSISVPDEDDFSLRERIVLAWRKFVTVFLDDYYENKFDKKKDKLTPYLEGPHKKSAFTQKVERFCSDYIDTSKLVGTLDGTEKEKQCLAALVPELVEWKQSMIEQRSKLTKIFPKNMKVNEDNLEEYSFHSKKIRQVREVIRLQEKEAASTAQLETAFFNFIAEKAKSRMEADRKILFDARAEALQEPQAELKIIELEIKKNQKSQQKKLEKLQEQKQAILDEIDQIDTEIMNIVTSIRDNMTVLENQLGDDTLSLEQLSTIYCTVLDSHSKIEASMKLLHFKLGFELTERLLKDVLIRADLKEMNKYSSILSALSQKITPESFLPQATSLKTPEFLALVEEARKNLAPECIKWQKKTQDYLDQIKTLRNAK